VRRWRTIYHAKRHQKKAGVAILISDKLDFKTKTAIRNEEGHNILIKGSTQQEDLTIVNIYAPNLGAANYTNQLITKLKKHIDNSTIIVGDFNTPLTAMGRSSKQINKETRSLNDTPDQTDLIDIFRAFHLKATEYTFFLSAHGTFSRVDHILCQKSGLNWYRKTEIIPCMFSDHKVLKLELNHKRKFGRNTNTCWLKSILLKNEWVSQEIKEFKKYMETNENENRTVQNLWDAAKVVLRRKHIAIQAFLKKQEKSQVHNLTLH